MSGKFFKTNGIDSDKVAECVGDIESLIEAVNNWRDELETYRDELESAKSDMEGADSGADIDEIVSTLQGISLPDAADTLDTTPESLSDALEDCTAKQSPYEEWERSMTVYLKALDAHITGLSQEPTIEQRNALYRRFAEVRRCFEEGIEQIDESVGVNR